MAGQIICKCGKQYTWKPTLAGKRAKCKCGNILTFPAQDPAAPPESDVPEGFDGMFDMADAPPPPPPPPVRAGKTMAPPPPPPVPAYRSSTSSAPRRRFKLSGKAIKAILIGVGILAFGIYMFYDMTKIESHGDEVHFSGRRSGIFNLLYMIGGKWAVVGLCVLGALLSSAWGVWSGMSDNSESDSSSDSGGDGDFGGGDD